MNTNNTEQINVFVFFYMYKKNNKKVQIINTNIINEIKKIKFIKYDKYVNDYIRYSLDNDYNKVFLITNSYYFVDTDLITIHIDNKYINNENDNYNEYKNNMMKTGINYFLIKCETPNKKYQQNYYMKEDEKNITTYLFGVLKNKENKTIFSIVKYTMILCYEQWYIYCICDIYTCFFKYINKINFYKQELKDNFENYKTNNQQFDYIVELIKSMVIYE